MLKLPVYLRDGVYYFHTRINGKQLKRSLLTGDKRLATIRAIQFLNALNMASDIRKFTIDIGKGIFEADDEDDYRRMRETLDVVTKIGVIQKPTPPAPASGGASKDSDKTSLRLPELVEKFFLLKKNLKPSTKDAYKRAANEFAGFISNPEIHEITKSDVTTYQEHLAKFITNTRTIDNKIIPLSSFFKFAIKQGYYFGENPAEGRLLTTKKDKAMGGYKIFEDDEIKAIYAQDYLQEQKQKDPDYYYCILLGLVTGARISEITSLEASQVKATPVPHIKINDSKTLAGKRDIPIPQVVYDDLASFMPKSGKIFKYKERLGKGSGNAVSQKFKRRMQEAGITREGLVFHSLRKYLNNALKDAGVQIEARCQFMGHELDNVNASTYARKYSMGDLAELVLTVQERILKEIKFH